MSKHTALENKSPEFGPTIDFNSVVQTFAESEEHRMTGMLGSYIYDVPHYDGDRVRGGLDYTDFIVNCTHYYLYTEEPSLLRIIAPQVREVVGTGATVNDLGSGPKKSITRKSKVILDEIDPCHVYRPCDIERNFVNIGTKAAKELMPNLNVDGIVINFQKEQLPFADVEPSLILFLGSTISNAPGKRNMPFLENPHILEYLKLLRRSVRNRGYMLISHDVNQDERSLLKSYDHPFMDALIKNVMHRVRRDLRADSLDPDAFNRVSQWNKTSNCVEHALIPTCNQTFSIINPIDGRRRLMRVFKDAVYIPVNSYKPTLGQMQQVLIESGWKPERHALSQSQKLAAQLCVAF